MTGGRFTRARDAVERACATKNVSAVVDGTTHDPSAFTLLPPILLLSKKQFHQVRPPKKISSTLCDNRTPPPW